MAQNVTISESEQDIKVIFPAVADPNMQNKYAKNNRLFRHTKQAVVPFYTSVKLNFDSVFIYSSLLQFILFLITIINEVVESTAEIKEKTVLHNPPISPPMLRNKDAMISNILAAIILTSSHILIP